MKSKRFQIVYYFCGNEHEPELMSVIYETNNFKKLRKTFSKIESLMPFSTRDYYYYVDTKRGYWYCYDKFIAYLERLP